VKWGPNLWGWDFMGVFFSGVSGVSGISGVRRERGE